MAAPQRERKPAVITGPALAKILTNFAAWLERQPEDEAFQIEFQSKQLVSAAPSLSITIKFDQDLRYKNDNSEHD